MKAVLYVCLCVALCAHSEARGDDLRGRVVPSGQEPMLFSGLVVEITGIRDRTIRNQVDVMADGSFNLGSIPDGDYEIRVSNIYGQEVMTTIASVSEHMGGFEIRLPDATGQRPGTGTVPLQQLLHPPSKQVRKLLDSGHKLVAGQQFSQAVARFREAAASQPDCMQAHADLAVALWRLDDVDGAAQEFRAAIALDPKNSILHSNLSATLVAMKRFEQAEEEASTALKLDAHNPRAHLMMGSILLQRRDSFGRAVPHLVEVQDRFPSAKKALETVCAMQKFAGCP